MTPLDASYRYCHRVARRTARNFFYSFVLLPRRKRRAMCALYAFLRHTDDLSDSDEPIERRRQSLAAWRADLDAAFDGTSDSPILPALVDTVRQFSIPREYLHDTIDGVKMDLESRTYETFADLREYCHRVASAVGLACIHIWGFRGAAAIEHARQLGIALQLTNILRDLREDLERGRVYLPSEDLQRFHYSRDDLSRGLRDDRLRGLLQFEIQRAREHYERGMELEMLISRDSQAAFRTLVGVYRALLDEIERRDGDLFSQRVRVGACRKARIAARALLARPSWAMVGWPLGADAR